MVLGKTKQTAEATSARRSPTPSSPSPLLQRRSGYPRRSDHPPCCQRPTTTPSPTVSTSRTPVAPTSSVSSSTISRGTSQTPTLPLVRKPLASVPSVPSFQLLFLPPRPLPPVLTGKVRFRSPTPVLTPSLRWTAAHAIQHHRGSVGDVMRYGRRRNTASVQKP